MAYTKLIYLDEGTLDKFGSTVADMITYLSKFPSHAELLQLMKEIK